jgi:hypothetical protein
MPTLERLKADEVSDQFITTEHNEYATGHEIPH